MFEHTDRRHGHAGRHIVSDDGKYHLTIDRTLVDTKHNYGSPDYVSILLGGLRKPKPVQRRNFSFIAWPGRVGREAEQEVIVKVFLTVGGATSNRAETEVRALKKLKEAACQHAPVYLGDFVRELGGIMAEKEHYVLMSFVASGVTYQDVHDMKPTFLSNPDGVRAASMREAFSFAIRDVHAAGVYNDSHHYENLMWDASAGKCYIIDFERASFEESSDWTECFEGWSPR